MSEDSSKPKTAEQPGERHVHMAEDTKGPRKASEDSEDVAASRSEDSKQRTTVLLAVDGSGPSNKAVDWYLDDFHKESNLVIFVHSFELPLMHSYQEMSANAEVWTSTIKHEADRTSKLEKQMMRKLKAHGGDGKFLVKSLAKPGEAILQTAEEENVDLIIMGTRGHSKLMRVIMGSVSNYVMNHAHCPVLVYRHKKQQQDGGDKKPRSRSRSGSEKKEAHQSEDSHDRKQGHKVKSNAKDTKED